MHEVTSRSMSFSVCDIKFTLYIEGYYTVYAEISLVTIFANGAYFVLHKKFHQSRITPAQTSKLCTIYVNNFAEKILPMTSLAKISMFMVLRVMTNLFNTSSQEFQLLFASGK